MTPPDTRGRPPALRLPTPAATDAFGARLAASLRAGDVVALRGGLGAGKTALARAVIRARAGAPIEVPSPTFTLLQHYPLHGLEVWHADLYRLADPDEASELGLDEAWEAGAVLIEWPDRLGPDLPADRLDLTLAVTGEESRALAVEAGPSWRDRLPALLA